MAFSISIIAQFRKYKGFRFDYFQGHFITTPRVFKSHEVRESSQNLVRLLTKLQSISTEFREIEEIILRDVTLSYKFMRLINSPYYGRSTEIKSIRQGLTFLGLKEIRNWVSLLFIVKVENKPENLMIIALFRAKLCELLSQHFNEEKKEMAFTVGLFSVLDALLDMPMSEVTSLLPLSSEILSALMNRDGDLGKLLECVVACERGDWRKINYNGIPPEKIKQSYLQAIDWAKTIKTLLKE